MAWIQLEVTTKSDDADAISVLLTTLGAVSITLHDAADQPLFEPEVGTHPLWQQVHVKALFDEDCDIPTIDAVLQNQTDKFENYHIETLEDQDWEKICMEYFHPMNFGNGLWVCPSWREAPEPNAIVLNLDPGLAFGTGSHPTTALCLEWLGAHPPKDQMVIDYGCGSGILSVAAAKLEAKKVYAVDIDPQAIKATKDNAKTNKIKGSKLKVSLPKKLPVRVKADLIIANILLQPLCDLAKHFADLIKPKGNIVVSGILEDQLPILEQTYAPLFAIESTEIRDGWARVVMHKP